MRSLGDGLTGAPRQGSSVRAGRDRRILCGREFSVEHGRAPCGTSRAASRRERPPAPSTLHRRFRPRYAMRCRQPPVRRRSRAGATIRSTRRGRPGSRVSPGTSERGSGVSTGSTLNGSPRAPIVSGQVSRKFEQPRGVVVQRVAKPGVVDALRPVRVGYGVDVAVGECSKSLPNRSAHPWRAIAECQRAGTAW